MFSFRTSKVGKRMSDVLTERLAAGAPPIVAILRGLSPGEAASVGEALIDAGIEILEIPLNSPDPLMSIAILAKALGRRALVGAGTVTVPEQVRGVAAAGGSLIVSPNTDKDVIGTALDAGLVPIPGFMTPGEAFIAISSGAHSLKMFPAGTLGTQHLRALKDVMPRHVSIWAVGGTNVDTLADWIDAGARGIGVGSALFTAGMPASEVGKRAAKLIARWRAIKRSG
jgi:2-dehydro-3-deoxyphosphogalactonate aldolase